MHGQSRSLLAQFGLTLKSKRGLGAGVIRVVRWIGSLRPALLHLRSSLAAGFRYGLRSAGLCGLRRLYLMDLRTTRKPRWTRLKSGVSLSRHAEQQ